MHKRDFKIRMDTVWSETYGGSFSNLHSATFWKDWILFTFDFLALPQSGRSYVQIGFKGDFLNEKFISTDDMCAFIIIDYGFSKVVAGHLS